VFPIDVPGGPDKVVAEPIPLRLGQVLDQAKDGGAPVGQDAAQLFIRQPAGREARRAARSIVGVLLTLGNAWLGASCPGGPPEGCPDLEDSHCGEYCRGQYPVGRLIYATVVGNEELG
jgi:hypothetical protein